MALWRVRGATASLFTRLLQPATRSSTAIFTKHDNSRYDSRSFSTADASVRENMMRQQPHLDISSQVGSCMPLSAMRIGTFIHNIEMRPGSGGKLVRAAGTCGKILKEAKNGYCLVKLPSGAEKYVESVCRATIGTVSNARHKDDKKLRKAGQSRWLGRRPVVRGVAMNPVDHPHGGGEGRSKSSGRFGGVSRTPWGKPTKSGYKTRPRSRKEFVPKKLVAKRAVEKKQ